MSALPRIASWTALGGSAKAIPRAPGRKERVTSTAPDGRASRAGWAKSKSAYDLGLLAETGTSFDSIVVRAATPSVPEVHAAQECPVGDGGHFYAAWAGEALAGLPALAPEDEAAAAVEAFHITPQLMQQEFQSKMEDAAAGIEQHTSNAEPEQQLVVAACTAVVPAPLSPPSPSFPPASGQVHIYRTSIEMPYVKELLQQLTQVQQMVASTAASSSVDMADTAAAGAFCCAKALQRAAKRIVGLAKGSEEVWMPVDALVTLREYGYADVVTVDCEQAEALNCLELEEHDLRNGRARFFHRTEPGKPWVNVGVSTTDEGTVRQQLGGAVPAMFNTPSAAASAAGGQAAGRLTMLGLAASLESLSANVMEASKQLKAWLAQVKAGEQATSSTGNTQPSIVAPQMVMAGAM